MEPEGPVFNDELSASNPLSAVPNYTFNTFAAPPPGPISADRLLHPKPEDMPCHSDKAPPNVDHMLQNLYCFVYRFSAIQLQKQALNSNAKKHKGKTAMIHRIAVKFLRLRRPIFCDTILHFKL
jgi:hypothetical protein